MAGRDKHDGLQKGQTKGATWRSPVDISKVTIPSADFKTLPADLPMKMVVERVCGIFELEGSSGHDVHGLVGHAVGLDFYTKGHGKGTFVEIVVNREPNAIAIEVDGEVVYEWVEDGKDMPVRWDAVIEEERRIAQDFVEQTNLQPGDFVDEDGSIIREDDELLLFDEEDEVLFDDEEEDNDDFID